jgi:hypothetical protein
MIKLLGLDRVAPDKVGHPDPIFQALTNQVPLQEVDSSVYKVYTYICPACKSTFVSDRKNRIYCSLKCSTKMAHRKKIEFVIDSKTNCFNCISHKPNDRGYSQIAIGNNKRAMGAHRFIWKQCFGEIPEGMFVCHKCDNPKCINPEHLFLGTQKDNMKDMAKKGRSMWGEKHRSAKLKKEQVIEIKNKLKNYKYGLVHKIAKEYGISDREISSIKNNKKWKKILDTI